MVGSLLSAISFLTRIPVPAPVHTDHANLRRAGRWYPAVGVMIGGISAGLAWLMRPYFPASVVAVLLLITDALVTGVLHLDGLADTADGFGGGRTREDVLRIMRDHAIGSYGGTALTLLLLFKTACLTGLIERKNGLPVLVAAPALARWSIVQLSRTFPYARRMDDGAVGTGALSQSISRFDLIFATGCCALLPFFFGYTLTLACWAAVVAVAYLAGRMALRRIGGITGDILGATVVIGEAVQFAVALLLERR